MNSEYPHPITCCRTSTWPHIMNGDIPSQYLPAGIWIKTATCSQCSYQWCHKWCHIIIMRLLYYRIYPLKNHSKIKSHKILLVHNIHFSCQIILTFCTEHGGVTAMLCAKVQNDLTTEKYIMCKNKFSKFEVKMFYIAINVRWPWSTHSCVVDQKKKKRNNKKICDHAQVTR